MPKPIYSLLLIWVYLEHEYINSNKLLLEVIKMFYYLYKITNWFNGKIYIGVHKTINLDDGYMGSGKLIKRAIKKYGLEYFTKEILQQFNSVEEMLIMESQIVNKEFVKNENTYNLIIGGSPGNIFPRTEAT